MKKIYAYVDGYNLYHGMMDPSYIIPGDSSPTPLRKYLWLNLHTFILSYFPKYYSLDRIHYFTAPIRGNPNSYNRQTKYWKALKSLPNLKIHLGKHIPAGNKYSEKQSDVNLALQLYEDIHNEDLQCIVLLSADSDQVPSIRRVLNFNKGIEIHAIFPPCRHSDDLRDLIHFCHKTNYKRLMVHQFPDTVITQRYSVTKPVEWA